MIRRFILFVAVICSVITIYGAEQNKTLFEYPVVPDTMTTLENRSNYFVAHFWEKCNLSKPFADDALLASAIEDYIVFFQYANKTVVKSSVNDLMNKAQSNMSNFWKIANVVEDLMYSPGAPYQSDEAYLFFVNNIMRSSRVKKVEKQRYQAQVERINNNQIGVEAQDFKFRDADGKEQNLYSIETPTLILIFEDKDCVDCSIARLRLSTNVAINNLISSGQLSILSISADNYSKEWGDAAKASSPQWINAASHEAHDRYDLRVSPAIYVLDGEKKIINKNISADAIISALDR
ncbi:MAG: DUF5106 domain-containing protein [Muribaculaceae bacterium]|nr:DUF5106 domain-containing protein [Muribaculaceae bacterium]